MNRVGRGWGSEGPDPCRTRMSLILAPQSDTGLMSLLWRRPLLPPIQAVCSANPGRAHEHTLALSVRLPSRPTLLSNFLSTTTQTTPPLHTLRRLNNIRNTTHQTILPRSTQTSHLTPTLDQQSFKMASKPQTQRRAQDERHGHEESRTLQSTRQESDTQRQPTRAESTTRPEQGRLVAGGDSSYANGVGGAYAIWLRESPTESPKWPRA